MSEFKIFNTKQEAQSIIDVIDSENINNKQWVDSGTLRYGDPIELKDGTYAVKILSQYENYFSGNKSFLTRGSIKYSEKSKDIEITK